MANTVLLKRSSVANSAPTSLAYGELALNYTDGNLYYQNASNVVTVIASNKFLTVTGNVTANYFIGNGSQLTGITANVNVGGANTYVQFNDNGVLGGNVKLTFNKTTGTLSSTSIVFPDSGGNTVGFTAPATVTSPVTWKLPPADGTVYGNVLATDTTGNLMWRGFSSTVFVYTRGNVQVPVDAINGYVNILGRTGNVYVSIT